MSLRSFLMADAAIAFAFGLGLVLIPAQLTSLYNIALNPGGVVVGQLLGATLLGFGALNCADLPAVAAGLAAALRPGAPVLLSLMTPHPLPALVERALTGRGEAPRGRRDPQVGGEPLPVAYPGLRELKRRFGEAFAWSGAFALGVLIPGPGHAGWVSRHPQSFGLLAALERLVRRWPILRTLGDHVVLEGARR